MRFFAIAAIATTLLTGTAEAQVATANSLQSSPAAKSVAFTKIVARMRPDEEIGTFLAGAICVSPVAVYWEQASAKLVQLDVIFAEMPQLERKLWFATLIDAAIHRAWLFRLGRLDAVGRVAHFLCETNARLVSAGLSDGRRFALGITQVED